MQNRKKERKKIGHILFNKIFLGYVLIATIFTSYHIFIQYSLAKSSVLKEMKTVEKAFYNGIATSVWHLDNNQINSIAEAITSIQGIIGISIISNNKEVLAQLGKIPLENKKYTTFLFERNQNISFKNNLIKHSFDITQEEFSPGESLGTVFIYTSENAIYSIVKDSLIFIFIYTFMMLVVLWILFNHFSNKLLTQPLNQLIQATKDLNIKEYNEISLDIPTTNKSELDSLVDTFNMMSKRITESFDKLKEQKKDLINANKYQTDFLANISHEFKTPLNSINVISSIMSKNSVNNLNEKQIQNLHIINKSGQNLLEMINDILDMSKLEVGELQLSLESFNIQDLILDLYERINPLANEKKIALTQNNTLQNLNITSDKKIVTHIIQNLLSNAIKFTNKGGVQLNISEDELCIIINVIDTGIGIEKDKLTNIFDRFKQIDGSTTRKYGGTGLGLAISKEFATLLEGELTVTSKFNEGSNFQFVFPKNSNIIDKNTIQNIKSNNDSNISQLAEKKEIEILLENDDTKINNEHINIVLFDSNPITFFSLSIALKKQEDINLISLQNEKEIITELKKNKTNVLIIESDILTSSLEKHIQNCQGIKVIGLGDIEKKHQFIHTIVPKSVDVDTLIKLFDS